MFKGTIPVADQQYDLGDPAGTVKTFAGIVVGFIMLFAATSIGQALYNRLSNATDSVEEVTLV